MTVLLSDVVVAEFWGFIFDSTTWWKLRRDTQGYFWLGENWRMVPCIT